MQFLQKKFLSCDRIFQSPLLSRKRNTKPLKTKWQDSWSLPRLPMLNRVSLLDWAGISALNRERLRASHSHLMIRSYTWAFLPGKMGETGKNPLQEFSGFREGEETGCDFLNVRFVPMDEPKRRQAHVFNASIPQFRFIYFNRIWQKRMISCNFSKSPGTHNRINALIELQ